MTITPKLRRLSQQRTPEPGPMPLALVRDDLDFEAAGFGARFLLGFLDAGVDEVTDIALEAPAKVFVEGRATGEYDILGEEGRELVSLGVGRGYET